MRGIATCRSPRGACRRRGLGRRGNEHRDRRAADAGTIRRGGCVGERGDDAREIAPRARHHARRTLAAAPPNAAIRHVGPLLRRIDRGVSRRELRDRARGGAHERSASGARPWRRAPIDRHWRRGDGARAASQCARGHADDGAEPGSGISRHRQRRIRRSAAHRGARPFHERAQPDPPGGMPGDHGSDERDAPDFETAARCYTRARDIALSASDIPLADRLAKRLAAANAALRKA